MIMLIISGSRCSVMLYMRSSSHILKAFQRHKSTHDSLPSFRRRTHYDVLGLSDSASAADIREAFVKLSKQIHPDINPSDPESHAKFVRLNEAYSVLSKGQSRREYDVSQGKGWSNVYNTSSGRQSRQNEAMYADGVAQESGPFDGSSYPSDAYYGIKGVRRVPNYVIAAGCAVVVALGFIYFFIAYKFTLKRQKHWLDTTDKRNLMLLKESQKNARVNSLERQLELLTERSRSSGRLNSSPPSPPPAPS